MGTVCRRKYALDWPSEVPDAFIELTLAKKWRFEPFCHGSLLDPGEHLLRAVRLLFAPEQWTISPWTEQHAHAWAAEDFSVWLGAASTGKAQPLDAPVMTPDGPVPMGSLKPGDQVVGLNGLATVLSTHDAGVRPEYRVVAGDGRETLCADDHLWTVLDRGGRYAARTVSAREICPGKHLLPAHGPVEFRPRATPVDPYLLGALLGDGTLGASSGRSPLSFTNAEAGVLDRVRRALPDGYELAFTTRYTWRIVKKSRRNNGKNAVIRGLRQLGLWAAGSHARFVPADYLYNSADVRLGLLNGLLDTDGTVDRSGVISFTSTSRRLADDVAHLVRSLGGRASMPGPRSSGYRKGGKHVACRPSYTVSISFPSPQSVGLFPGSSKKRARLGASARRGMRHTGIVSSRPTGRSVPMRCITVDAKDGLYLTGSFMPTHNSNDAGGFAVLDWITDPFDTYIALASTSVPMLRLRSFESVIRYFRILKAHPAFQIPGKESVSQTAIVNDNDDGNDATAKASVRGVALSDGDEAKAVARLAGAHLPWVTIVLDEGSALPEAAAKARFNASAGTRRFRFVSLANPVSRYDEATKLCVPVNGWESVTEETESWRSRHGLVLHHNGFRSPAILEPDGERKYPFLINQRQIDRMLSDVGGNADDPMIWRMVKGFPAPLGTEGTVLSQADLVTFHALEEPVWLAEGRFVDVAGLDPAFVAGGDACILQRARVGRTREGVVTVWTPPPDLIPILASSQRPATYQVVDRTRSILAEHGIPVGNLACDDSGTQSVCDVLAVETGVQPIRCNFSSRPTEPPDGSKPRYRNLVTEIWHLVASLVRDNQIRGMPSVVAEQLCSRRYQRGITPLSLESKDDYRKRRQGQRSPDEADAYALACFAAVRVGAVRPGYFPSVTVGGGPASVFGGRRLSGGYENPVDDGRFRSYTIDIGGVLPRNRGGLPM